MPGDERLRRVPTRVGGGYVPGTQRVMAELGLFRNTAPADSAWLPASQPPDWLCFARKGFGGFQPVTDYDPPAIGGAAAKWLRFVRKAGGNSEYRTCLPAGRC